MKNTIGLLIACLLVVSAPAVCGAEDEQAKAPKLSVKEQQERDKHIQILLDRVVNKKPQFSMIGQIRSMGGNRYSINGEAFAVNKDTMIQGKLRTGAHAEVRGFLVPGKDKLANQIVVFESSNNRRSGRGDESETHSSGPREQLR